MANSPPTVEQVKKVLGSYSIASIQNWLRRCELAYSASSREEIAQRVHGLIVKGDLTMVGLEAAMIGIEEASSKRTFLYRIPPTPAALARINKQLTDLKTPMSTVRVPATDPKKTTKVVYVINDDDELRAKWTEMHKRVQAVRKTREWKETNVPKVVVLIVDKVTGLVQLRCDHPEDEHSHLDEEGSTDDAYYSYFIEQAENLLGHALEPVDLRPGLEKVLKAVPRIVRTRHVTDETAEGGVFKRTHKQKHKDVRDLAEWQYMLQSKAVRTWEAAPVFWLKEMSNGALKREVFSDIDCEAGLVRFDADCYEEEIAYVLAQLV